jgi:hypothetical protein
LVAFHVSQSVSRYARIVNLSYQIEHGMLVSGRRNAPHVLLKLDTAGIFSNRSLISRPKIARFTCKCFQKLMKRQLELSN